MSGTVQVDHSGWTVRTAVLHAPYEVIKSEAATLGIEWHLLHGLTVTEFEDGSSVLLVRESDTQAVRLLDHLLARRLVLSTPC